eukprot:g68109.t1
MDLCLSAYFNMNPTSEKPSILVSAECLPRRLQAASLKRTASFWFGPGSSQHVHLQIGAVGLSWLAGTTGVLIGLLFALSWSLPAYPVGLDLLYSYLIPASSGAALFLGLLWTHRVFRAVNSWGLDGLFCHQQLGRKALLATSGTSFLFVFSCFYRALNIADEGAAACRGPSTAFNAPVAGRAVATVGEIALIVQLSLYIQHTAERLGATNGLWRIVFARLTTLPFTTLGPGIAAEALSWSGVISGHSVFFCAEYVMWMLMAFTWAWDSAELMNKSTRPSDIVTHATLLSGSLGLFFFNAFLEIPHFFIYQRSGEEGTAVRLWDCVHDAASPLWLKRLPFFVCYFVGCSWCSIALAYRFVRAVQKRSKPAKQQ